MNNHFHSFRGTFSAFLIFLAAIFYQPTVLADDPAPVTLLKQSTVEMLAVLKAQQPTLKTHPEYLESKIRSIVVPKFDVTSMAQSVVGRRHWESASPAQRQAFIREFTNLVISVYSAPLQDYNGDRVEFSPLRNSIEGQTRIAVQTTIVRPSGQRIAVNYSLKNTNGNWKVYDFSIEGISMIASYRSQFAAILENQGIAGLLGQMHHSKQDA